MSAPLTVDSLAEMFPALGLTVCKDIAAQCDNNCELALEKLLELQESPARLGPLPPPPGLHTCLDLQNALFPGNSRGLKVGFPPDRGKTPPNGLAPSLAIHPSSASNHPLPAWPPDAAVAFSSAIVPTVSSEQSFSFEDIIPGLATLDAGLPPGSTQQPASSNGAAAKPPARRPRTAPGDSRAWWPRWPVVGPAGSVGAATPPPRCSHRVPTPAHPPSLAGGAGSALGSSVGRSSAPADQRSPADSLLEASKYRTPPRAVPRPLGFGGDSAQQAQQAAASPCSEEDEALAALMPHLAHCLTPSPPMSGTVSPAPEPALLSAGARRTAAAASSGFQLFAAEQEQAPAQQDRCESQASDRQEEGYGAAELVSAVEFHLQMFPNLKREVVGDVLQRYSHDRQLGLEQLIMLSACVEDASGDAGAANGTAEGSAGASTLLAWDSLSSGSDDEHAVAAAGSSWEAGLTPEELAGMEQGIFPAMQPQQAQRRQRAATPDVGEELPPAEKRELLQAEFPSVPKDEVAAALAACDGKLFSAAELLRSFAAEDERAKGGSNAGNGGGSAGGLKGGVAPPEPASAGAGGSGSNKVQRLARRFPGVPIESLEVALASCNADMSTARRTLREAGYTEAGGLAEEEPAASAAPTPATAAAPAPTPPLPCPVPLPPRSPIAGPSSSPGPAPSAIFLSGSPGGEGPSAPPAAPAGLSLSEATYRRNQSIFEQERAHAARLEQAFKKCFELAQEAYQRGDRASATELSMRGREYRQQFFEEQSKASRRISKRVNSANGLPRIRVDLHGQTVADALATVESGIRNLPESIPGGVVVRYITGKGLHSAGGAARIRPEVLRLLGERGIPFVAPEEAGWVEATLAS